MKIPTKKCRVCKKVFEKPSNCSRKNWRKRVACSSTCKKEWSKGRHFSKKTEFKRGALAWNKGSANLKVRGEQHGRWKGGRFKSSSGYIFILVRDHPYANKNGYVREHRYVIEQEIGRYLLPTEIVHHKNEVTDDNRLCNLQLLSSKGEHSYLHGKQRGGLHQRKT